MKKIIDFFFGGGLGFNARAVHKFVGTDKKNLVNCISNTATSL